MLHCEQKSTRSASYQEQNMPSVQTFVAQLRHSRLCRIERKKEHPS